MRMEPALVNAILRSVVTELGSRDRKFDALSRRPRLQFRRPDIRRPAEDSFRPISVPPTFRFRLHCATHHRLGDLPHRGARTRASPPPSRFPRTCSGGPWRDVATAEWVPNLSPSKTALNHPAIGRGLTTMRCLRCRAMDARNESGQDGSRGRHWVYLSA
jgi:hypothetical protein